MNPTDTSNRPQERRHPGVLAWARRVLRPGADGAPAGTRGPLGGLLAPPDDRHGATRAMAVMLLGGAVFMAVLSAAVPSFANGQMPLTFAIVAVLGICGVAVWWRPQRVPAWAYGLAPYPAAAIVMASNLATSDASAGAQLFLLWPVLYAAMFLSGTQTALVLGTVVAGDAVVVASLLESSVAVTDTAGLATALAIACAVIFALRRRVAALMGALERQALEDQLTGLLNRRALDAALATALATHRRSAAPVALLTVDLDNFKTVNDRNGHAAGDTALRRVADVLRACVRAGDVLGRMGGDEFVVILADCDRDGARRVAEEIRAAVQDADAGLTVSVGVAAAPADGADADSLSRASDAALYGAKLGGRNRVVTA